MKKGIVKRILAATVAMGTLIGVVGCSPSGGGSKKVTLNVYNWGEYIGENVIKEFEKKYNIKVNYETYATNEEMYQKLKAGGTNYDVIIPSDYMIEKLKNENMLQKIDYNNVPNYKYIDDSFKNQSFDPQNEYTVPYMWGTVGIVYNKTMVKGPIESWDSLWDPQYSKNILMLDSPRESIGVALQKLGYSLNTKDQKELEAAKAELIKQKPLVLAYVVDETRDKMINGEAAMAVTWAGDAVNMMKDNPDLAYVVPKPASNKFIDAMCIPSSAKNKKAAEEFINFMTSTEIGLQNAEYIGYSTPQTEVKKGLPAEVSSNPAAYPSADVLKNTEVYTDLSSALALYDRIWTEVKSTK